MSRRRYVSKKICKIEGCNKPVESLGWCAMHKWRMKKYGTVELPERPEYLTCACEVPAPRKDGVVGWNEHECSKCHRPIFPDLRSA